MAGGIPIEGVEAGIMAKVAAFDPEPISKTILAVGAAIVGIFGAAHQAAIRKEAQTMAAALPQWRQLQSAIVDAYNKGDVDAQGAINYTDQARKIYYTQTQSIAKGKPPIGGVGIDYYYGRYINWRKPDPPGHGPPDPCNGPCNAGFYFIEPEAAIMKNAFASNTDAVLEFQDIPIRHGPTTPGITLTISPPLLEKIIPAGLYNSLPQIVKQHGTIFAAVALVGIVFLVKR